MPYITSGIEPELFLEHHGVRVYHAYAENNYDHQMMYLFTTDPSIVQKEGTVFDILDFNVPSADKLRSLPGYLLKDQQAALIEAAVREAIEAGLIVSNEE